jgi:hypothetical protein
VERLAAREG